MNSHNIECIKLGDVYHFKIPRVTRDIFKNKKVIYGQESHTIVQMTEKINILKKQLTELTHKKNMAKALTKSLDTPKGIV